MYILILFGHAYVSTNDPSFLLCFRDISLTLRSQISKHLRAGPLQSVISLRLYKFSLAPSPREVLERDRRYSSNQPICFSLTSLIKKKKPMEREVVTIHVGEV